jgi:hypothetical protein
VGLVHLAALVDLEDLGSPGHLVALQTLEFLDNPGHLEDPFHLVDPVLPGDQ